MSRWMIPAAVSFLFLPTSTAIGQEPEKLVIGPNVNMVSGTEFPGGDPFLQRQNEPSGAVSSRNELHLLAGSNDYRTVDIPFEVPGAGDEEAGGDSWLGVFFSTDGGSRWSSTLHAGYPQDPACSGGTPPALCGYQAGADAVVRAGTHGLFYYAGIVFDRGEDARSAVFVSRFVDLNNDEGGEPIRYVDSVIVDSSEGAVFLDKPWIAVGVPGAGSGTVTIDVPQRDGTEVTQTVECGPVYVAYAAITGSAEADDLRSQILFRSSHDCGATWSDSVVLSDPDTLNQGALPVVAPTSGDVYVAWRQFSSIQSFLGEALPCAEDLEFWRTHPQDWPVQTLSFGGVSYTKEETLVLVNRPPQGDATYILVRQLVPAKLNNFLGIDGGLSAVINLADTWLAAHPIGSNPKGAARAQGIAIKDQLDAFNLGAADPPQCGLSPTPGILTLYDAILVAKSSGGGQSFTSPVEVSTASPFDQGSTQFSFRSTAYATMAADADGRVYVAWAERGKAIASPDPESGDSRIVLSSSADGSSWSIPFAVDPTAARGHQLTPSLLFAGGKLVLAYYDFRQDISNIFEPFVIDMPVGDRVRHSVDVRVSIADPGPSPVFTDYSVLDGAPRKPSQQTSRYPFVITGESESNAETVQLQYMTPNIPLFEGGGKPFIGDYIDVTAKAFIRELDGTWRSATSPGDAEVYHAFWTDNRDVVPPNDGDWTSYVPPMLEGQDGDRDSIFAPGVTVPDCNQVVGAEERTGMRNQNIYTAILTHGLVVGAPGNTRLLGVSDGEPVQRSFIVFVQNVTEGDRRFRLSAGQSEGVEASFEQFALQGTKDVTIPAFSSAAQTVYLRASDPRASVLVAVTELELDGTPKLDGLASSVRLNPDPSSPASDAAEIYTPAILNPAIFNPAILNPAILNPAIFNPAIMNPAIFNPAILNPAIFNPAIFNPAILNPAIFNPAIFNPAIFNPAILNPAIFNPAILNPAILNPAILNPAIFNPAILNPAILNPAILNSALDETSEGKEITFVVRNDGNTTGAYDLNFNVGDQEDEVVYQLMVFKLNVTPVAEGCQVAQEAQQQLLVNVESPLVNDPRLLDAAADDGGTATFSIEPGGQVFVTLRVFPAVATGDAIVDWEENEVSLTVVSQPVDSEAAAAGDVQPSFDVIVAPNIEPLVIDAVGLPDGQVGVIYPTQAITATGGSGTQVWSVVGAFPPGLNLGAGGTLDGTPASPGSFAFTLRVTDATQIAELALVIDVFLNPLTFAVSNVADGGAGSVRQAILDANAHPGPDFIEFNLPGAPPFTISPTSALPAITSPVSLDATTQPGFSGTPVVELEGSGAGATVSGLVITAGSSTVRGLVINRFDRFGIEVTGSGNTVIERNYIGTDVSGSVDQGNGSVGVFVQDSQSNVIGGFFASTGNVISGNGGHGVAITGATATGNSVQGNRVGTDASGSLSIQNNGGVRLIAPNNTIGGSFPAARNVISGNNGFGIFLQAGSDNTVVQANFVGVDASGTSPLGNAVNGIQVESDGNTIGGTAGFESNVFSSNGQNGMVLFGSNNVVQWNFIGTDLGGTFSLGNGGHGVEISGGSDNQIGAIATNLIVHNSGHGIAVLGGVRNASARNVVHSNGGLGIDLGGDGVTANDPGDTDAGANDLINFPVLSSATTGAFLTLTGTMEITPSTPYDILIFSNVVCDPSGHGEGEVSLGAISGITPPSGVTPINSQFAAIPAGLFVTAVVIDGSNNTSELSACVLVTP